MITIHRNVKKRRAKAAMTAREWFEKARREHFALGAFNVGNLETLEAIVAAARQMRSPVLVESSSGETKFLGAYNLVALVREYREREGVPIFLNLDHSPNLAEARVGIEAGYDLIHFDGSQLPYEENLSTTKTIVQEAHAKGQLVEGEIEHIAGSSEVHLGEPPPVVLSDPHRAKEFVAETGVDTLAVSIGNVHGLYQSPKTLDIALLKTLRQTVDCYFSLHGSSGIADDQIRAAVAHGIVKINLNTEIRQAYRQTLEKVLREHRSEYAMYKIMPPVIEAVQHVVERKMRLFGSAGKAA